MGYDDTDRYFVGSDKQVEDGDVAYADDLNTVTDAVATSFNFIGTDLQDVYEIAVTNAGLSELYAITPQGTEVPSAGSGTYSSLAYGLEAKGWVLAGDEGEPVYYEADGSTVITKGAKQYSEDAAGYASDASDSADAAEASALIAAGQNTVSAGDGIRIDTTGAGPYDFEINRSYTEEYVDVNLSRVLNTPYENTTSEVIWVIMSLQCNTNAAIGVQIDGTFVLRCLHLQGHEFTVTFPVPPGATYNVLDSGSLTVLYWNEFKNT